VLFAPAYLCDLTTSLAVDNHRVLHGRSAFDGKRRVCGAYIGVDEYRSKLAVLKEKFEDNDRNKGGRPKGGRSVWSADL
jgi:trimethyllysine dioxygenase